MEEKIPKLKFLECGKCGPNDARWAAGCASQGHIFNRKAPCRKGAALGIRICSRCSACENYNGKYQYELN